MKIVKLDINGNASVHEFPKGSYSEQNKEFRRLIGEDCRVYQPVTPHRLLQFPLVSSSAVKEQWRYLILLVDEEGLVKDDPLPFNPIATFFCNTVIVGNVLFISQEEIDGEFDFCGIDGKTSNDLIRLIKMSQMVLLRGR